MSSLTITELETARDNLVRQLAKGVLSVTDANGEQVTFASPAAMQRALATIESQIAALRSQAPNVIKFNVSKGT